MLFVLAVVVILLLLVLAGADLFVAQYNSDELSNMGVQEKWRMTTKPPSPTQIEDASGFIYLSQVW